MFMLGGGEGPLRCETIESARWGRAGASPSRPPVGGRGKAERDPRVRLAPSPTHPLRGYLHATVIITAASSLAQLMHYNLLTLGCNGVVAGGASYRSGGLH